MPKVKIATAWLAGCAGCHMSFLDLDEAVIDVAGLLDITSSPVTDIKEFPQVDVGIIEGAVANTDNEETLKKLRANCKIHTFTLNEKREERWLLCGVLKGSETDAHQQFARICRLVRADN